MKKTQVSLNLLIALLACTSFNPAAFAQSLPTWQGSFTYQGTKYNFIMVGTNPATTLNGNTQVPTYLIPLKVTFSGCTQPPCTFDPQDTLSNGQTVVQNVTTSPIFSSEIDFKQGGTDLGQTQYIDAFQRGNFWKYVKNTPDYHLLLQPLTVMGDQLLSVPANDGEVCTFPYGFPVGQIHYPWLNSQLPNLITSLGIEPNSFAIFLTYDTLTVIGGGGGCGVSGAPTQGFHAATSNSANAQTYAYFGYVDPGSGIEPDVSILAHEVGEWADNPLVNNNSTPCGGNLEVGDPLIGDNYAYHSNNANFTYHVQDLVFLPYFGAPRDLSVNQWLSFQNEPTAVCAPQDSSIFVSSRPHLGRLFLLG